MSVSTQRPGVELTEDRAFTQRVRRLVWISLGALALITVLAVLDDAAPWMVALMLLGWVLMPSLLSLSIHRPRLRYGLVVPGTCFTSAVIALAIVSDGLAAVGWWLIAAGLVVGGTDGIWFWMRWLPVPRQFEDPFGLPRLTLIGVHVTLLLAGIATVLAV
jgi:hypothetical protein